MKALVYGADRTMVWRDDAPGPEPRRGHYLIRVIAVGLNPFDEKLLDVAPMRRMRRHTAVGMELVGRIEHAPAGAELNVGDLVMAHTPRTGALAELVNTPMASVAALPDGVDPIAAAALPHAGVTALAGLADFAGMSRALIIGASGGVGTLAIQIAKTLDIKHVTTITSTANTDLATELGAHTAIAYDAPDFALPNNACPAGSLDVILDCATSSDGTVDYEPTARPCLRPDGTYVATESSRGSDLLRAVVSQNSPLQVERRGYRLLIADATAADLQRLSGWLAAGSVVPRIAATVPFAETELRAAYDRIRTRRTVGKLVATVEGT